MERNWSVVKILTENGERVGILEDASEGVPTVATGLSLKEADAKCAEYCMANNVAMYQGDCRVIDFV
jgi:hypothetical protein